VRRALSAAYQHIADAQGTLGDLNAALESFRSSLALRVALSTEFPNNTEYRRLVANGEYWQADTLAKLGRAHEALEAYRRSLAINDELAAADPKAERGIWELLRVGNMLDRLGDHQQALGYYHRAHAILVDDVEADPGNLWRRAGLIEVQASTCAALVRLAKHTAASATCGDAVRLIEQTTVEPTNAVIRASLARSYKAMADAYVAASMVKRSSRDQRLGYARGAREMYQKSVAIWSDMAARGMLTESDDAEAALVSRSLRDADSALHAVTTGS
jgi:tetratricopeptide (TPR) repeat protein